MLSNKKILKYENLIYEVKNKDKKINSKYVTIINGLSATIESGKVTAVMGASGCGKTHLFELLIGNLSTNCKTSGKITYNGQERDWKKWTKQIAFLPQDDIYYPDLTTYESIIYNLSFNSNNYKENIKIANDAINCACIFYKKDAPIRTLSGGERKRAMMAITMANNPEILILDEPTAGLDSYSALKIVESLKKYAVDTNNIVIMTVHQPGDGMFNLFDDLIFLTRGGLFYAGPVNEINSFLESTNICPPTNMSHSEALFMLHSDPKESEFARKYENAVKDIVYRNAVKDPLPEPKACNNKSMVFFGINVRHIFILLKHNFSLMLKSPDRFKSYLMFIIFSLLSFGPSVIIKFIAKHEDILEDYDSLRQANLKFSEKLALSYVLFSSEYMISVALWTTFFSINMQDEVILKMELFTRKYSLMTYYLYNFVQKFLCSYIFLTIGYLIMFIIDFNSGYPAETIYLLYPIIIISLFLTVAVNLLLTSIPLGFKMSYFIVLCNTFGVYCGHTLLINAYKIFLERFWDKTPLALNLLLLFPNYCFDIYSMTKMRIIRRNTQPRFFHDIIEHLKFYEIGGYSPYAESTPIIRSRRQYSLIRSLVPNEFFYDPKFALSLISFDIEPNTLLFIIPISFSICVMLTLLNMWFNKVSNIRTKLMS
ncbi:ABC transporter [Vairimorpha necatrix]|uniref:ABC transporter n=1 Tax=Vairimorpha necatrix TaxID=6039 RepID=A0AAX4JE88_9MICR